MFDELHISEVHLLNFCFGSNTLAVMAELEAPLRHAITSAVMAELKAPLCNLKTMTSRLFVLQFNPTSSHASSIKNKEYWKKAFEAYG
jgi:hypothetical protein